MPWFVYILKCRDDKLYTGITNNLKRRILEHKSGNGCKFTRCRIPVKLLFSQKVPTMSKALKREAQIKQFPRQKKLELIQLYNRRSDDKTTR